MKDQPLFSLSELVLNILESAWSAFLARVKIREAGPLGWWLFLWLEWVLGVEIDLKNGRRREGASHVVAT